MVIITQCIQKLMNTVIKEAKQYKASKEPNKKTTSIWGLSGNITLILFDTTTYSDGDRNANQADDDMTVTPSDTISVGYVHLINS